MYTIRMANVTDMGFDEQRSAEVLLFPSDKATDLHFDGTTLLLGGSTVKYFDTNAYLVGRSALYHTMATPDVPVAIENLRTDGPRTLPNHLIAGSRIINDILVPKLGYKPLQVVFSEGTDEDTPAVTGAIFVTRKVFVEGVEYPVKQPKNLDPLTLTSRSWIETIQQNGVELRTVDFRWAKKYTIAVLSILHRNIGLEMTLPEIKEELHEIIRRQMTQEDFRQVMYDTVKFYSKQRVLAERIHIRQRKINPNDQPETVFQWVPKKYEKLT